MNKPINHVRIATEDCISLEDACNISGKSKSTIRYYIKQGHLTKYVDDLEKVNAPLRIHRWELLAHLGKSGRPSTKTTGRKPVPTSSIAVLEEDKKTKTNELNLLNKTLTLLRRELDIERSKSATVAKIEEIQKERIADKDALISDLQSQLRREREKVEALEMKIDRMSVYFTLPWWKKWNSGIALLTSNS